MRNVEFIRDMLAITDLVLWELYRHQLGFAHFSDGDGGGKRMPIRFRVAHAAAFVQRTGVIA
jgi:hypothetical protein